MTIPLLKKQQKNWDWKIPINKTIIFGKDMAMEVHCCKYTHMQL